LDLRRVVAHSTASCKLDLNLEHNKMRAELEQLEKDLAANDSRIQKDLAETKVWVIATKSDVMKYSLSTIVAVASLTSAVLRIFKF